MIPTLRTHSSGFTLAELSIVLVVIGLIVGGIFVGTSLIRNAELQSVISDVNRFKQAAKLFRDKYKYLPGDFPRAEEFWGSLAGCPNVTPSVERTKRTCNGNGDGFIARSGSPLRLDGNVMEALGAWQHLATAELIEGQFSGAGSPAADDGLDPGLNIPKSKLPQSGFTLYYSGPIFSEPGLIFRSEYGHIISFGRTAGYLDAARSSINGLPVNMPASLPALTSEEALRIDRQVDDGSPGTGNVLSYSPGTPGQGSESLNCATTDSAATAEYKTDEASYVGDSLGQISPITCSLIFITGL